MSEKSCNSCCRLEWTYAHTILRLWVGLRLFMAGIDKFRTKGGNEFSFENLSANLTPIKTLMMESTPGFLLPKFMITPYFYVLTAGLIIAGITSLLGVCTRLSLFVGGLLFVSLSHGIMALPDDKDAVWLGIQVAITAFALVTASHNQLSVDGLLGRGKKSAE
ncbi:MAG: DoxX family membrane protein [Verrucomicrobiaceae bacterium]|nr:DoxX family membrane protein [Verrucomicrobiaceae bacterium]